MESGSVDEQLEALERISQSLEPSAAERIRGDYKILQYAHAFVDRLPGGQAFEPMKSSLPEIGEVQDEGVDLDTILHVQQEVVDSGGLNAASGGHLGFIPGGGIYASAWGDFLAATGNRYAGLFFASPGAVQVENRLISWVAGLIGYDPAEAGGNLTSGGSVANLIAVVAARKVRGIKSRDIEDQVIYTSEHAHHSVDKAVRIAGLEEATMRHIPVDDRFRMQPDELRDAIEKDLAAGKKPMMVVAAAGTTNTGTVDPLEKIAAICEQYGLWYHIDAAYGGFFLLTEEGKAKLKGIEKADSVVMDPHKGLFIPYGSGMVMVKKASYLQDTFGFRASYMQDANANRAELSPAEMSPELTKHFRGLRMWVPLKWHGLRPFRAALEEKRLLALYFFEAVRELGYEVGPEPDLTVVIYRWNFDPEVAEEKNREILAELQRDGRIFLSSTSIRGTFMLRIAILSFRTHRREVDVLLEQLKTFVPAKPEVHS